MIRASLDIARYAHVVYLIIRKRYLRQTGRHTGTQTHRHASLLVSRGSTGNDLSSFDQARLFQSLLHSGLYWRGQGFLHNAQTLCFPPRPDGLDDLRGATQTVHGLQYVYRKCGRTPANNNVCDCSTPLLLRGAHAQTGESGGSYFFVEGDPIKRVHSFWYLGRVLFKDDDNTPCVKAQLTKTRQRWARWQKF